MSEPRLPAGGGDLASELRSAYLRRQLREQIEAVARTPPGQRSAGGLDVPAGGYIARMGIRKGNTKRIEVPDGAAGMTASMQQSGGSAEAADGHAVDLVEDMNRNDLRAGVGEICPRCGRVIDGSQPVRRMVSGQYQHDSC